MADDRRSFIFTGDRVKSELNFANSGLELGLNNVLNKVIRDLDAEGSLTGVAGINQRKDAEKLATQQINNLVNGFIKELVETSVAKPVEVYADSKPTAKFRWVLGKVDTEHCPDCLMLSQKPAMTKKQWLAYGLGLPRHGKTECSVGCKCMLAPEDQKVKPSEKANQKAQQDVDKITNTANPLLAPNMAGKHTKIKDCVAWVQHNLKIPNANFGTMPLETANQLVLDFYNLSKRYRTRADLPDKILNSGDSTRLINEKYPAYYGNEKVSAPNDYLNFSAYSGFNKFYVRQLGGNAMAHAGSGSYIGFSSTTYGKGRTKEQRKDSRDNAYKTGFFSTKARGSTMVHEYGHTFSQNHINHGTKIGKTLEYLYNTWMRSQDKLHLNFKTDRDKLKAQIKRDRKYLNRNYWTRMDTPRKKANYEKREKQYNDNLAKLEKLEKDYMKQAGDQQISIYGMTNVHEFVAESFCAYYFKGKESRHNNFIQAVGEIIDEVYGK